MLKFLLLGIVLTYFIFNLGEERNNSKSMDSLVNKYFSEKLKYLRIKSNQIQNETAERLGMKQQNYSKLENGGSPFTDRVINKICKAFKITPKEFINIQCQFPQIQTSTIPNINNIDDYTTRILFASFRKQIAEQKLRIAELEIEARAPKIDKAISNNFEPIYVMI